MKALLHFYTVCRANRILCLSVSDNYYFAFVKQNDVYTHVHATAVRQPNCTHERSASGMKRYIIWSTVDLVTLHPSQLSDKGDNDLISVKM